MTIATAGKSGAAGRAMKASGIKKPRVHPPYVEMISEAIASLKERTGSSQVAIAKFIEEKQKELPPNFRKLLLVQLKKLVVSGKLTKVKKSFKLSGGVKPAAPGAKANKPKVSKPAAAPKKKSVSSVSGKAKAAATKKKVVVKKPKISTLAKKSVSKITEVKKTPVKKAALSKIKKTPVKKPKSIKSPMKKARK